MAKEILNLEVKTNIKGAVTEVDEFSGSVQTATQNLEELNEQVSVQNKYIADQETELVRLKEIQDSIPKGAWFAGQSKLSDDIRDVTSEIRSEKDALKKLKGEQKDLAKAIRDKTSAQKKDTNSAIRGIQHFQIMGVSIRKLKYMVRGIIPTFKLLFGTIKSGIASTGIGLLLLAIVSIGTSMKKSTAGAKAFKAIMSGIGEITGAITTSLMFLGDTMLSVFGFDSNTSVAVTAAEKLEQAYKDLGKQMDDINLKDAQNGRQKLKNKQIIDDETKSEKVRIAAANENWHLDRKIGRDKLYSLQEINREQKTGISQGENGIYVAEQMGEVTDDLIEKQDELLKAQTKTDTDIAKLKTKRKQEEIDYSNTISKIKQTAIDADIKAADDQAKARKLSTQEQAKADAIATREKERQIEAEKAALQELIDLETDRVNNQILKTAKLLDDFGQRNLDQIYKEKNAIVEKWNFAIEAEKEGYAKSLANLLDSGMEKEEAEKEASAKRIELEEAMQSELSAIDKKYSAKEIATAKAVTDAKKASVNDQIEAGAQLAGALSSLASDNKGLAVGAAIMDTYAGANKAYAQGGTLGFITAAAVITAGLKNVQTILSTDVGDGGGGSVPSASTTPPAPQMMSGAFQLEGGQEVQPLQAYVVSDDITDSQNGLAIIRRRATI